MPPFKVYLGGNTLKPKEGTQRMADIADPDHIAIAAAKNIAEGQREAIKKEFPSEYGAGLEAGFLDASEGPALRYPANFNVWNVSRRSAWFAGWNYAYSMTKDFSEKSYKLEPWAKDLKRQIGDEAFYRNHPELRGYE